MKRIIERIKGFDLQRMISMVRVIHERSNHSCLWIVLDIFRCWIKFGSGYMDYYLFYFETLSDDLKATYINVAVNKDYVRHCNNPKFYHIFHDKVEFLEKYKEFIQRDYIDLNKASYEEYVQFFNKHKEFMAKPIDGLCGKGIELVQTEGVDPKTMYDQFIKNRQFLLEEKIAQNKDISEIYPNSINTIRVVTLNKDGKVSILFRCIRIGNGGRVVDNFNSGGMFTIIDEDGVIRKPALDKNNDVYYAHPMTKTNLIGFKIPRFEEVIDLCKKLALVTPEMGLVGWDIAITQKGIDVVEGNEIPGYDIYQSKDHLDESRMGIKKRFDDAIYPERIGKKIYGKDNAIVPFIWVLVFSILVDIIFYFFNINTMVTAYSIPAYLFINRNIDKRPISKTILYCLLVGIVYFLVSYAFYTALISDLSNNDLTFFIRTSTKDVILLLFGILFKSVFIIILEVYFAFPAIEKLLSKIEIKIGNVLTILLVLLLMFYVSLMLTPIFYLMMMGQ